jgi:hypothetical protein
MPGLLSLRLAEYWFFKKAADTPLHLFAVVRAAAEREMHF